jgi:vacuolar protein sorting-associated protein 53
LRLQILEDFSRIGKGSQKEQLYEACFALDAIGESAVNELRV